MSRSSSPKRTALQEQQNRVRQHVERIAAAQVEVDKIKDSEERAAALVGQRESELAALDRAEAELIASGWSPNEATDEQRQTRRKAEEDLAAARRALAAIRQHGDVVRVPVERAAVETQRVASETASFVDDVLREEADTALAALVAARAEVVRLEAVTRSIAQALAHRKSYRHAEVINVAVNTMNWPEAQPNSKAYLDLAERLLTDADALAVMS